jgi:MFS family permease
VSRLSTFSVQWLARNLFFSLRISVAGNHNLRASSGSKLPRSETVPETSADPSTSTSSVTLGKGYSALPHGIWALGLGAMFMDMSSELVHSLLPVFMASVLGASMVTIGLVEGTAEATAAITKMFSGAISDYVGKRKFLVVMGYGLATMTKPIFPLANSIVWVMASRFIDRVGKGIRDAPRDALIADITPEEVRGAAYGLRQALDSVGAFVGPLLAVICLAWLADDIRAVLWVAVVPAVITVALIAFGVEEPDRGIQNSSERSPIVLAVAHQLPSAYWLIVSIGAVFTLARFSQAFLVLRAQSAGLAVGYIPTVMIVMNIVYAAGAYPAGIAADIARRRTLLLGGLAALIAGDLVLAGAESPLHVFAGAALWGLHMALTEGLLSKLVADEVPAELRGTGFGIYNLVTGVVLLFASVIAGALWSAAGAGATFLAGAVFAATTALLCLYTEPNRRT